MLVVSRKRGERIRIGDDIVVTVCKWTGSCVRIGIEAPKEMTIVREEITRKTNEEPAGVA